MATDEFNHMGCAEPHRTYAATSPFWMGWGVVLVSTYLVDHFALFGLKQVSSYLKGRTEAEIPFKSPALYKMVRHPLYLGFIIAFWSTPRMTFGHLFFSIMTTAYIVVAIQFEERDLMNSYGDTYRRLLCPA